MANAAHTANMDNSTCQKNIVQMLEQINNKSLNLIYKYIEHILLYAAD